MTAKSYATKANAERAIKKEGLQLVPHTIHEAWKSFMPVFYPLTPEDRSDLIHRGFVCEADVKAPWYPKVGKRYRHYKGQEYLVTAVSIETETNNLMIVYKPLYECPIISFSRWMHGHDEDGNMFGWMDPLPRGGLRFTPID